MKMMHVGCACYFPCSLFNVPLDNPARRPVEVWHVSSR